ncbi:acyltransferase [Vibrio coralliilyticus]|uniref:acyltransferase n=1 Tax=Vibrio TaxID=662 RepID=UPI0005078A83|nr:MULTISPECIES: acyltransferase [Vibrio]KFI09643.1 hypothetical protein IX95_23065 [Vibrio sp. B183]NOI19537.1 acyltransferase [Vibrio coralliilyticus]
MIKNIFFSIIEYLIINIPGGLGQRIRYQYYKRRFKKCGKNVRIDIGVIIQNPENIEVGNDVWFLPYSIVTSRPINEKIDNRILIKKEKPHQDIEIGTIKIGNQVSIGAYNIIQGYGGITIKDRVTTSARVSLYSFSHYPNDPQNPTTITYANSMVKSENISCIESPLILEEGVWIGLNVIIFGGLVGRNSFVSTNSVVLKSVEENSYAAGSPAKKVKNRFVDEEV